MLSGIRKLTALAPQVPGYLGILLLQMGTRNAALLSVAKWTSRYRDFSAVQDRGPSALFSVTFSLRDSTVHIFHIPTIRFQSLPTLVEPLEMWAFSSSYLDRGPLAKGQDQPGFCKLPEAFLGSNKI